MRPLEQHPWIESYRDELLEQDSGKLADRISVAEAAINARIAEIGNCSDLLEASALHGALSILRLIVDFEVL